MTIGLRTTRNRGKVKLRAAELAFQADQEAMYKLLEADDALATAYEEIKRLNQVVAGMELRLHGLMAERNEAVKMLKGLQRRCDRLQAEQSGYKSVKGEIRLDQEIKGRASIAESLSLRPPFI